MKVFIGTKIILGEPMTQDMFQRDIKKNPNWDEFETIQGYHVVYPNPNGNYHSWSPADVFEGAYRELNDGEIEFVSRSKADDV